MIYEIMNRAKAHHASGEVNSPTTAIISITDKGDKPNTFFPQEWIIDIHHSQFNDVIKNRPHALTAQQAKEIADFVIEHYNEVDRLIIQCEFGQSRSAGVAAAICEFFEGHDNGITSDPAYLPNWHCYHLVLDALKAYKN